VTATLVATEASHGFAEHVRRKTHKDMGAMANQGEKSRAYRKEREKLQFIEWLALPSWEREPKTQRQLAKKLRVNEVTLSEWAHS
jgi:hypothetical protein